MFSSIDSLILDNYQEPFFAFRPGLLSNSVNKFINGFDGQVLYSVKTNPLELVLKYIYQFGIKKFDVASINEIKIIKNLFSDVEVYFMNPVKPRYAISEAYFKFGVRHFCLDSIDELNKITEETNFAKDLILHLRIAVPNKFSKICLSEKFGVSFDQAPFLLRKMEKNSLKIGICFHPGSQCMDVKGFSIGMKLADQIIEKSKVNVTYFNVGGGFPSVYQNITPKDLNFYFKEINNFFAKINKNKKMILVSEPGRSLVSECMSLIVRVQLRKDDKLYINDGVHGSLRDAGKANFAFPVTLIKEKQKNVLKIPFSFYGPTCDSSDFMKGPFYLPMNIEEGDYIEIRQMGAYSKTMQKKFNGFNFSDKTIIINDEPQIK